MYQVTEGALARCPVKDKETFENTLVKFRERFPEFISLLMTSNYWQSAKESFADDILRSKTEPIKRLSQECLYMKSFLESMLTTELGERSVEEILTSLKQ